MPVGQPEFVENPSNRCPVILLLDTSTSMTGEPISQLNQGLSTFFQEVSNDDQARLSLDLAIITFGGTPTLINDFQSVDQLDTPQLQAEGGTPMGEAIDLALDYLEKRKANYKDNQISYYRPWVFLITDGAPNNKERCLQSAQRIQDAEAQNKLLFFAVAVKGADMATLQQIAPSHRPPVWLKQAKFEEMFLWLSDSVGKVADSVPGEATPLAPVDGWAEVNS